MSNWLSKQSLTLKRVPRTEQWPPCRDSEKKQQQIFCRLSSEDANEQAAFCSRTPKSGQTNFSTTSAVIPVYRKSAPAGASEEPRKQLATLTCSSPQKNRPASSNIFLRTLRSIGFSQRVTPKPACF